MTTEHLLVETNSDGVATLTLNRPESLNSLSMELEFGLRDTIAALSKGPERARGGDHGQRPGVLRRR